MKTNIISLSHYDMFKAVISNNKHLLAIIIQAILDYYKMDIKIKENDLIFKRNTHDFDDKVLICNYAIKISEDIELNIEIKKLSITNYQFAPERNPIYCFNIFYYYKKDKTKKNNLFRVNLSNNHNPNGKCINSFYLIDIDDIMNISSNNLNILNIDIASCYDLIFKKDKSEKISVLHAFGAMLCCNYLEEISFILEQGIIEVGNEEKEKFLNDVKEKSQIKMYR